MFASDCASRGPRSSANSSAELAAYVAAEISKWAALARINGRSCQLTAVRGIDIRNGLVMALPAKNMLIEFTAMQGGEHEETHCVFCHRRHDAPCLTARGLSTRLTLALPRAWAACRVATRPRDGVTPPTLRWSARGNSGRRSCRWQQQRIQESLRSPARVKSLITVMLAKGDRRAAEVEAKAAEIGISAQTVW